MNSTAALKNGFLSVMLMMFALISLIVTSPAQANEMSNEELEASIDKAIRSACCAYITDMLPDGMSNISTKT